MARDAREHGNCPLCRPVRAVRFAARTRPGPALVTLALIDSFTVLPDGLLETAPGSPFKAQGVGLFASGFRPTAPSQLFVSSAHNGTGDTEQAT